MSIEAIHWAFNYAPIPHDRRDSSSLAVVLLSLANHADPQGRNAFPSLATLAKYTRLTERSIRYALRALEDLELIRPSDPEIVAAYIKRNDRRPKGYDLAIERREPVDNSGEGHTLPPVGGQSLHGRGAEPSQRGAELAPEPSLNRPRNLPARERAPEARSRPECGQCDARPGDPISARVVWLDIDRVRSIPCPTCSPVVNP